MYSLDYSIGTLHNITHTVEYGFFLFHIQNCLENWETAVFSIDPPCHQNAIFIQGQQSSAGSLGRRNRF